tara:strand:+ start:551 stop:1201 length:651 start_codon:yes stop_codon:yes gene_type:complete
MPNQIKPVIIAVDGTAASGKGTLARRIASELGYLYLDTGLLYRSIGLSLIKNGLSPNDERAALREAENLQLQNLNENDSKLRSEEVGRAAGILAAKSSVRAALVPVQRNFALNPLAKNTGVVMDGRDIGTVIWPEADFKFFIDAEISVRAARRAKELHERGDNSIPERVLLDIIERDARDRARATSPLIPAVDASVIDTTNLSADAVFDLVMSLIR